MGVRGLKALMAREGLINEINIKSVVENRIKNNPNESPIICIDFMALDEMVDDQAECICGGRHLQYLDAFEHLFKALIDLGVKLVFFSDLNTQPGKVHTWLSRRNQSCAVYANVYDDIELGDALEDIVDGRFEDNRKGLTSTVFGLRLLAKQYGEFHYAIDNECDFELAKYATEHKAMAVITNDTDFVIFDGQWRVWSTKDFDMEKLMTFELDRCGMMKLFGLSSKRLPLFATLIGNDFTGEFYDTLTYFHHNRLERGGDKFKKVAAYVRDKRENLTDDDIDGIVYDIFHFSDKEKRQLLRDSIESYDPQANKRKTNVNISKKLLESNVNEIYADRCAPIQRILSCFYDMRGCENERSLMSYLVEFTKREVGIAHQNDDGFEFMLLAKCNFNEGFVATMEKPIYPSFEIPPLERLLLDADDDDDKLKDVRWKLLGWILSIPDEKIEEIRKLPKDLILICTTLYVLVKNLFLDVDEADGILSSEQMVLTYLRFSGRVSAELPSTLIAKYVRAAHIYNIATVYIRYSFGMAGLMGKIENRFRFDGVCFQNRMNSFADGKIKRSDLVKGIKAGRIYLE